MKAARFDAVEAMSEKIFPPASQPPTEIKTWNRGKYIVAAYLINNGSPLVPDFEV